MTIFYKSQFLGMDLIPKTAMDLWQLEISLQWTNVERAPAPVLENIRIPIPQTGPSQVVKSTEIKPADSVKIIESPAGTLMQLPRNWTKEKGEFSLSSTIQLFGHEDMSENVKDEKLTKEERKRYKNLSDIQGELREKLQELSDSLVFPSDEKMTKLKKIFFYMSDEMILQPHIDSLSDTLTLLSGSYLGQARLLAALARLNDIPARIAFGVQILKPSSNKTNRYTRVFYAEVFMNGNWVPINPDQKKFGSLNSDFIVLHQDTEEHLEVFNNRDILAIFVEPLKFGTFKSDEYINQLSKDSPIWSTLSLHRFPLSIQSIFFGILLIPFGTIILSFARVLIGVNTFGIFTPILLTLFFLETSFAFGFTFFMLVVLLGLTQRFILDRFYILAVPRLSILLTFVILMYVGFAIVVDSYGLLSISNRTLNYFPIVIITVFIERFSIYFIEEGARNTLKTTFGTFLVAALCYLLLSITWLKVMLFNNPELILFAIGMNLTIGNYKGYRLLELTRFSGLRKL